LTALKPWRFPEAGRYASRHRQLPPKGAHPREDYAVPFKSQAQRRALYGKDPKLAREFEAKTPKGKKLPERVKPKSKRKKSKS
jgi:hypothetical protein